MSQRFRTLVLAFLAVSILPMPSFADHWTSVASAGAIDVPSNAFVSNVAVSPAAVPSGQINVLTVRYNITNTSEFPPWATLEIGYIDSGGGSNSISATIYRVSPGGSPRTALCTVTSADFGSLSTCSFPGGIDFSQFLYYVEATLTRVGATQLSLRTLRVY